MNYSSKTLQYKLTAISTIDLDQKEARIACPQCSVSTASKRMNVVHKLTGNKAN
jgi:DNA-directed RNA polymerase subunit RPC12/RpoP